MAENLTSLEVNYLDIANTMPVVAIWLADHPREMLPILSETAMCECCPLYNGRAAWQCAPTDFVVRAAVFLLSDMMVCIPSPVPQPTHRTTPNAAGRWR